MLRFLILNTITLIFDDKRIADLLTVLQSLLFSMPNLNIIPG
jgi:hypothetical protein